MVERLDQPPPPVDVIRAYDEAILHPHGIRVTSPPLTAKGGCTVYKGRAQGGCVAIKYYAAGPMAKLARRLFEILGRDAHVDLPVARVVFCDVTEVSLERHGIQCCVSEWLEGHAVPAVPTKPALTAVLRALSKLHHGREVMPGQGRCPSRIEYAKILQREILSYGNALARVIPEEKQACDEIASVLAATLPGAASELPYFSVVHQDFSPGNMVLTRGSHGVFIDLDFVDQRPFVVELSDVCARYVAQRPATPTALSEALYPVLGDSLCDYFEASPAWALDAWSHLGAAAMGFSRLKILNTQAAAMIRTGALDRVALWRNVRRLFQSLRQS